MRDNDTSPHILNASSNLLGICFLLLTSLKLLKISAYTIVDDITAIATLFFMISCILSFISIRRKDRLSEKFESVADIFFMIALFGLFITSMLITLDLVA